MRDLMGRSCAWLFGRRSYEDLLASWNAQGDPFKDAPKLQGVLSKLPPPVRGGCKNT
jgi:hypothetical protein